MRRKILSLLSGILAFSMSCVQAQEYGTLQDITPLPPNTASLLKTWEKPVGTYTGIVPVSIPIYAASQSGVSVPISIDYTGGGGIKVEEIASSVGLGWNLSVGGSITRIKNGLLDETPYYGYANNDTDPLEFDYSPEHLYDYTIGLYDLEPDLYIYSFNGISGRFAYDQDGNIVVLDRPADVKIELNNGGGFASGDFVITDDKGYKYYFGGSAIDFNATDFYTCGWYLTDIFDPNGVRVASFQYQRPFFAYKSKTQAYITKYLGCCSMDNCGPGDYGNVDLDKTVVSYECYIDKIIMGGDSILFSYGNRLDLRGSIKLDKIEIKDAAGNLRKKFKLNYGYFIAPYASTGTNDYDSLYKRLKLVNISEQPTSGTDSLTHSFTYNEDEMLPDRLSTSTDYWGFYNGLGGYLSIPNGIYNGGSVVVTGYADRRTYHDYTGANTLTRVTFPTGGYREFTYEGNQVLYEDGFQSGELTCDLDDHTWGDFFGDTFNNYNPMVDPAYTQDFTVDSDFGSSLFNFYLDGWADDFVVKIIDKNGMWETVKASFENDIYGDYLLPNGDYRLELYYSGMFAEFYQVHGYWQELQMTDSTISRYGKTFRRQHRDAGGQRVKTIDDYDPVTAKHKYTHFKYYIPGDTTLSSGMLIATPLVRYPSGCPTRYDCDVVRISSISAYPLNAENGSYVVYPNVRVIEEGNGYIDQEFTYASDDGWGSFYPPVATRSSKHLRGKPVSTKYYNESGALIKNDSTDYFYPADPAVNTYGIRIAINSLDQFNPIYCTSDAGLSAVWSPLPRTEWSTTFTPNGNLQTKTEYTYFDNLQKAGVNRMKVTRSDGSTTETWYRHPYNSNSDFKLPLSINEKAIKDTLLLYNILQPIESRTYVKSGSDSVFVGGGKVSYDFFSSALRVKNTKRFSTLSDSATVNFSVYDSKGNVCERYLTDGTKEVYLWGYDSKYIVAKVVGSDYSTVSGLVNNSVLQSPSSESALRTELNNIRTGLAGSKAQVATYTYLPTIGISSVTDPAGRIMYYEYDAHGRLTRVRDQDKNILKKNTYSVAQ